MIMLYTFATLVDAASKIDLNSCDESYKNELAHLLHVYRAAYDAAPEYIIGVGRLTYAENALLEYQTQKTES